MNIHTHFPATENPISEGGIWLNGETDGLDWLDVQTTTNLAFSESEISGYNDPTAILTGTWENDQRASAVVQT